ncbi:MAG: poly(R)-hydroxyalkanoic acid synthase subunit PhaE [Pseudomonadota bacterium]
MAANDSAEDTLFRLWREGARAFAELGADAARAEQGEDNPAWERMQTLSAAWSRFLDAMAAAQEERMTAPGASPFDPAGWMRPPGDGGMADLWRWLEGPEFADLFTEERSAVRESAEWARYAAALEQFRMVMARGWMRAFRTFAERLAAAEGGPSAPEDDDLGPARRRTAWDVVLELWRTAADEELARVQTSDAYIAAQRDLMAAHLAVRASLRARAERMAQFLGLPTRAEMDDLAETVHSLRREVAEARRAARRAAAQSQPIEPDAGETP